MRSSEVGSLVARCPGKPVRCCPAPRSPVSGGPTHVPGGGPLSLPGTRRPGNVGRGWLTRCFCWSPGVSPREASLCRDLCRPWPGVWCCCPRASQAVLSSQGPLLRWLKVNFSEAFIAWIHIKALRVFVESVLRCVEGAPSPGCPAGGGGSSQLGGPLGLPPLPSSTTATPCPLPVLLLALGDMRRISQVPGVLCSASVSCRPRGGGRAPSPAGSVLVCAPAGAWPLLEETLHRLRP